MFRDRHPAVNLIFYLYAIGITMFSNDPYFTAAAFAFAWAYSVLLKGKETMKNNLFLTLPVILLVAGINTLFTHNGATVLFYINDARITREALLYGIDSAFLLSAVIIWFISFSEIMTSDKLIYVFGKARPVMGLTLSMIFRFIPLLKERFREIRMGQRCMGRIEEKKTLGKIRQAMKEISILISWSLEAAIETSDSMEARGYGLRGRTSFHLFRMTPEDWRTLVFVLLFGTVTLIACILGETDMIFYPKIVPKDWTGFRIGVFVSYLVLLSIPMVMDIQGKKKWKFSK